MKIKKNLFIISLITLGVVLLLFVFFSSRTTLNVAFYGIDDSVQTVLKEYLSDYSVSIARKNRFTFTELNKEEPLDIQVSTNKVDIVIAYNSKNLISVSKNTFVSMDAIEAIPSALRSSVNYSNPYALPLFLDNFEIAYLTKFLTKNSISAPVNLSGMVSLAENTKGEIDWPIIFAGSDDLTLSLLISSLIDTRYGTKAYNNFIDLLVNNIEFANLLDIPLNEDTQTLRSILNEILNWEKAGFLHPQWLKFTKKGISYMLSTESAAIAFMTLSNHRSIDYDTISLYTDSFFPSGSAASTRSLIAPIIVLSPLTNKKAGKISVESIQNYLISSTVQGTMSAAIGLAPANSIAPAQDKQASSVRLWIASSEKALPDMLEKAYTKESDKKELMNNIRTYFISGE